MKGIPFRPEMIRAIINGSKTVTRRVIKPQPFIRDGVFRWTLKTGIDINLTDHSDLAIPFARYKVGETVYIKEAWEIEMIDYPMAEISYVADEYGNDSHDVYIADKKLPKNLDRVHPPIFMPAWAARTFIKITDVRPERLNAVTEEDAIAEGITIMRGTWKKIDLKEHKLTGEPQPYTARYHFEALWDSKNGKTYPFKGNYWCFVYTFEKVDR